MMPCREGGRSSSSRQANNVSRVASGGVVELNGWHPCCSVTAARPTPLSTALAIPYECSCCCCIAAPVAAPVAAPHHPSTPIVHVAGFDRLWNGGRSG